VLEAGRRGFFDESGTATNMVRRSGRVARINTRVPHGHRKATPVAGLRAYVVTGARVISALMCRAGFLACVE